MSRRSKWLLGGAVWALGTMALGAVSARAQDGIEIPEPKVVTVFDSDTIPGYGAVGGVTADALGYVYVADFRNRVWRVDPDNRVELFADGLYGASGNAVGPTGEIYQSSFNGNYVARIDRTGQMEVYAEGLNGPVGIVVGREGELYVTNCNGGSIARIAPDRTVTTFAKHEMLACPNGITMDDKGDLYVVSFNSTAIARITPDGNVTSFANIQGAGGNGHIVFARGGFYVTKNRGHQIFRVSRSGHYQVLAGTGQKGQVDGAAGTAQFSLPNGIAIHPTGAALYVNDLVQGAGLGLGPSRSTLRKIELVTLPDVLASVESGDSEQLTAVYDAYAERYDDDTANEAVNLAFQWLSNGRFPDAMALFTMNAERYPEHAGAQYNLGEAYRYTGRPDDAAKQYRRTLELDPDHPFAEARLALVGG